MNCRLPVAVSPVLAAVLLVTVSPNVFDIEVCSMSPAANEILVKQMPEPQQKELRQRIREAGLRATPARAATLDLLHRSEAPLTHADVAEHLAERGIDKATAYRNLNDMTDAGLLRRTELGDHVWRFEPIGEGEHGHTAHPHFVCVECGIVSCLSEIKLTAKSLTVSRQVGEITEILLRGHCRSCT